MPRSFLNQLSRNIYLANRTVRDIQAVKKGRIVQRVANRAIGRTSNRLMRKLWR